MTIRQLTEKTGLEVLCEGLHPEEEVTGVFCCDLLSIAMSRGKEGAAFVTVMGNANTVAVVSLTEMRLIVLAEGVRMDETGLRKAREAGISVLSSREGIFESALLIHTLLEEEKAS